MKKSNVRMTVALRVLFLFLVGTILLPTVSTFGQTAKPDFSGTWTLNESKSQLGEGPGRRAATKMTITQDASSLTNERTSTRQSGETMTLKEKYSFDGSETDNSSENRKKKSTAAWSANMQELTVNSNTVFERNGNTMEMKSAEVYKLSGDGKTLTIENTSTSQRGEFKTTLVYDKSN